MSADPSPARDTRQPSCCWEPPGGFTPWFSAIFGGAGGLYVFLLGFRVVAAQSSPGGVACGNCLWSGLFAMFIVAPLAGMILVVVGGAIGFLLDEMMSNRRRASFHARLRSRGDCTLAEDGRTSID